MPLKLLPGGTEISVSAEVKTPTGTDRMSIVAEAIGPLIEVEIVDDVADTIEVTGHGLSNGDIVNFTLNKDTNSELPTGLMEYIDYYVVNATSNDFQVSETLNGAVVDITGLGIGKYYFYKMIDRQFGTEVQTSKFEVELSAIESWTLPEGTDDINFWAYNADNTEDGELRHVMVNYGPTARPYVKPTMVLGGHNTYDIKYTNDISLEDLRPSAAGADVSVPSKVGVKKNFNTFDNPNGGELYIHGFTAEGQPADVDGAIYHDGQIITVPRGKVSTHAIAEGWLVFDTALTSPFVNLDGGAQENIGFCVKEGSGWKYDNNSELVPFTPTDDMIVIGTCVTDAVEHVSSATAWSHAIALGSITVVGADKTADAALVLLQNPSFEQGDAGWSGGSGWEIVKDSANAKVGTWCARRVGTGVKTSAGFGNKTYIPVTEGERVYVQGAMRNDGGVNADSYCRVRVNWRSAAGNDLGEFSNGSYVEGPFTDYAQFRVLGTAPAGAAYARPEFVVYSHANGTWYADEMAVAIFPKHTDIDLKQATNAVASAGADKTSTAGLVVLENPNFEAGDTGWSKTAEWSIVEDAADARNGSWLAKFDSASAETYGHLINSYKLSVEPGDRIFGQGWFKGGASGKGNVVIRFGDAAGVETIDFPEGRSTVDAGQADYEVARVLSVAPAGAVYARVMCYCHNTEDSTPLGDWMLDGATCAIFPKNADIDLLEATNAVAEADAERTTNKGTDLLIDTAGYSNSADWGNDLLQSGMPNTLAGHHIDDAQPLLPLASAPEQVLQRDTGGDVYFADKYGTEINAGLESFTAGTAPTFTSTGVYTLLGSEIVIPNPGREVLVIATLVGVVTSTAGSGMARVTVDISFDGGNTYSPTTRASNVWLAGSDESETVVFENARRGTPTGDIYIRVRGHQPVGAGTLVLSSWSSLSFRMCPRSDYALVAGDLAVTYPSSAYGSCSKNYTSGTSCTASVQLTATPTGGVPPYAYFHYRFAGTDLVTSGSMSQTCTVSGTHTTQDGGLIAATITKCDVTDASSDMVTSSGCDVSLEYFRTYSDISVSAPNKSFSCEYDGPASDGCNASGQMTVSTSGGDESYSHSWSITGEAIITSGAFTETPTVSHFGHGTLSGPEVYEATATVDADDGRGNTDSDTATVTFTHVWAGKDPV